MEAAKEKVTIHPFAKGNSDNGTRGRYSDLASVRYQKHETLKEERPHYLSARVQGKRDSPYVQRKLKKARINVAKGLPSLTRNRSQ